MLNRIDDAREPETAFVGTMEPGVLLSGRLKLPSGEVISIPDYLAVDGIRQIALSDKLDPSALPSRCAIVYDENAYITDDNGNIAYIHCRMKLVSGTTEIRRSHREYQNVGGVRAVHEGMDAGHFGLSLGQHPSIAMEQDSLMNRFGAWRQLEKDWAELLREGHDVLVRGVFVDGDCGTYAPFWCVEEIVDGGDPFEYILTNDASQS